MYLQDSVNSFPRKDVANSFLFQEMNLLRFFYSFYNLCLFRKALLKILIIIIIITWTKGSFFGMFTSCCRREKQEVSSWRPSTARMDQHRHRGKDITEENKKDNFFRPKNETKLGNFFLSAQCDFYKYVILIIRQIFLYRFFALTDARVHQR